MTTQYTHPPRKEMISATDVGTGTNIQKLITPLNELPVLMGTSPRGGSNESGFRFECLGSA